MRVSRHNWILEKCTMVAMVKIKPSKISNIVLMLINFCMLSLPHHINEPVKYYSTWKNSKSSQSDWTLIIEPRKVIYLLLIRYSCIYLFMLPQNLFPLRQSFTYSFTYSEIFKDMSYNQFLLCLICLFWLRTASSYLVI